MRQKSLRIVSILLTTICFFVTKAQEAVSKQDIPWYMQTQKTGVVKSQQKQFLGQSRQQQASVPSYLQGLPQQQPIQQQPAQQQAAQQYRPSYLPKSTGPVSQPPQVSASWQPVQSPARRTVLGTKTVDMLFKNTQQWPEVGLVPAEQVFANKQPPLDYNDFNKMLDEMLVQVTTSKIGAAKISSLKSNQFPVRKIRMSSAMVDICFIGDIHGSWHSLMKILRDLKIKGYIDNDFKISKEKQQSFYIVCTGDYIDRGVYGVEVLYALMSLKLANWNNVYLLRGNHETKDVSSQYGFKNEIAVKYSQNSEMLLEKLYTWFDTLYQALYIGSSDGQTWVQCCHGGLHEFTSGNNDYTPIPFLKNAAVLEKVIQTKGFDPTSVGGIGNNDTTGFLWDDLLYQNNMFVFDSRGRGLVVHDPVNVSKENLVALGLKAIFRGHQHNGAGLKMISHVAQDNGTPVSWELVVSPQEKQQRAVYIAKAECPVFTFTTATELNIQGKQPVVFDVSYGLLRINSDFNQWVLVPVTVESKKFQAQKPVQPRTLSVQMGQRQVSQPVRPSTTASQPPVPISQSIPSTRQAAPRSTAAVSAPPASRQLPPPVVEHVQSTEPAEGIVPPPPPPPTTLSLSVKKTWTKVEAERTPTAVKKPAEQSLGAPSGLLSEIQRGKTLKPVAQQEKTAKQGGLADVLASSPLAQLPQQDEEEDSGQDYYEEELIQLPAERPQIADKVPQAEPVQPVTSTVQKIQQKDSGQSVTKSSAGGVKPELEGTLRAGLKKKFGGDEEASSGVDDWES